MGRNCAKAYKKIPRLCFVLIMFFLSKSFKFVSHCLSFTCQMGDLLGRYSDLMDGFNEFLSRCERNGKYLEFVLIMMVLYLYCSTLLLIKYCFVDGFLAGVMSRSKHAFSFLLSIT